MTNPKKIPILKVILIVWVIFASVYVVYGEYQRVQVMVAQRAYNTGLRDAVNQLIQQAQTCQPIPVNSGDSKVTLISVDCLNASADDAEVEVN